MSDKAQAYAQWAEEIAESLTKSLANWTGFLATVGRLYKYPYHEQLMIYAQRPDATACADYELWNNKMNRYVHRGSKGIALLDDTGDRLRLKYVFDVSDTGGRENSRYPFLWRMQEYHKDSILETLKDRYDTEGISVSDTLYNIAKDLAAEYYEDHKADIEYLTEGSFLEDYDEDNVRVAFEDAAAVSIAYTLMKRCGLDTEEYFDHEDFLNIFDFNTADAVAMLGTAVSEQSEQVLRQIALTIAKIERERSKSHERTHLQQERGLSDTRPHIDRADGEQGAAFEQIRQNEEKIPTGTQNTVIPFPAPVGEVVSTSTGNRSDSQPEIGADNGRLAESADTARQEEQSDGLGGTHEQSESTGGGNDTDRAHIQLSLFPTEEEQIQSIVENERNNKPFRTSTFSLQQEEIEHELKNGTGTVGGKFRVHQFYQSMPKEKAAIDFIKQEYGYYGHSHTFTDGTAGFVDYQPSFGMKITRYSNPESQIILKWHEVEKYLRSVVLSDRYLSEQEKEKAGITEQPFVPSSTVEPIISVPDHEPQTKTEAAPQEQEKAENFRITDDILGEGSKREKFARNIAAITTLQTIEREHRIATKEEQEILSQYIGWGGLSEAFDKDNSSFSSEYTQLKALLSDEEYSMARASTLNAHYTTPMVIRAIYEAVEKMGFETGNILEPACGTGNFFGMLPDSMQGSRLYGIELDSVTGRIAKQLYPDADIAIAGFEKTDLPDNFFDLAIGNVPFGNYKLSEKRYDSNNFLIHDHFFAKALDKVRPGGVVAFITSKGTLDKQTPDVRRYLAQRAELLGAVRLPNNAFLKNAGTEVASDIIFLQKRDRPIDVDRDWIHLDTDENGITLNSYFADHPEMILGKMEMKSGQFGMESTCTPIPDADLAGQLKEAIQNIEGNIPETDMPDMEITTDTSIPADPAVKNHSYTLVDGEVYYRENSRMVKPDINQTAKERIAGMVELRECVNNLIRYQLENYSEETIKQEQVTLNRLYDSFTAKYGLINSRGNSIAFSDDNSYYLLCSLENIDENGNLQSKADMFTKRTIKKRVEITSVDTASEALALSIAEKAKVDMTYMGKLTGLTEEQLAEDLKGVIFPVPMLYDSNSPIKYVTADEYLSGNVREKLRIAKLAAQSSDRYISNVKALEAAQPKDLDASEIDVRLGTTWIDKKYVEQFMYEVFDTPYNLQGEIEVKYAPFTAEWNITNKNSIGYNNVAAYVTYGTGRANAYRILEDSLNLRDIRIYDTITDPDGKERRVLNKDDTTLAQQKQQAIKDEFRDWIWKDADRRQALVREYNEKFNSIRPREYDGKHINFVGINPEITLRTHQVNAIAHILYGDNTLLAHEVGAGKTYEMVAAAMESKRLGLCQKPLFAVPNHLTEQWASEFLKLYPAANILVATRKDFEKANRKKFCSKIATGDYDAVIMGHSQFERIPMSIERQERLLNEQIDEIIDGIEEVKASGGERFTVKQLERTKKSLEQRLEKLQSQERKDNVVTFEQLGVDRLYVDEAHNYKNLFLYTKMRNVAGLSTTDAQKSSDMFMKCRYMDELTGGKGIVFATGTPVSNSMTVRP